MEVEKHENSISITSIVQIMHMSNRNISDTWTVGYSLLKGILLQFESKQT